MYTRDLEQKLVAAQRGDSLTREELIKSHRDSIARVSSQVCRKFLAWDHDDELSIAQVAFNEAIDKFKPGQGASFYSFARMIIHNRLVDFIRKESRHNHESLTPLNPGEEEPSQYDIAYSTKQFHEEQNQAALAGVVEEFIEVLGQYRVTLDDLVKVSPKHRDSRETLSRVALCLASEPELLDYMKKNKLLPVKKLASLTRVKRKVLERGRKYLIALALIFSDERFRPLKEFTRLPGDCS
ncbi:RNA polymerase sigma factor [Desulfotomaculum arcticum]|uniref:RNA polymerase sigma factor SigI n=1 Tax=Desulfotruncus arcticus DSM 17038 TaxID=1121424 RepID=A0A1I2UJ56_9FIRM|nr:RNA polymerase sigma-I factor [Desulfotruncus arcticus]SFG77070.1 RNA polymerase sigma factor [Desulfotomaculum arcticum] [Desulfotruncus arcticus DSM 17038]